ncbi:DUF1847 domain-containing protein [Williamwhitmania taraxaci]|uniref:Uncharacterized metal-binding protein n=1 Tax=Williamwhitmania taraxaci TaxID=1640674 RepID=A0A1G6R4D0_9BACT|nr:DUF1847 domain-containing protein [Williamwhitmania taraxaci]SDC98905.1 Uncharacterized metal-binding protein [Williamwhitmania taraxaci]
MALEQYGERERKVMQLAEEAVERGANRLAEIRSFALRAGFKKIGIAHCAAVTKEAVAAAEFLSKDFEVLIIECKTEQIPKSEFLGEGAAGISCNPLGQAEYLNANGSELNIVMGICMGHDILLTQNAKAPCTTLLVKDRVHRHNPMEGIKQLMEQKQLVG